MICLFNLLNYSFVQHAFLATIIVAIMSSIVGYYLVLRGQTFAGHALSHISFTGATGAILIQIHPMIGMLSATLIAGLAIGILGEKLAKRDVSIGIILSLALAFGLLFSHWQTGQKFPLTALLFGNVLAVDKNLLIILAVISTFCITIIAIISRPLLLMSLQPEIAEARGVKIKILSIIFMMTVSLAVTSSAQIVGILLVFTFLITPAASALNFTIYIRNGFLLTLVIGIIQASIGLLLSISSDWPVSFCITFVGVLIFALSLAYQK